MLHHHHGSFIPSLLLQYLWRKYDFWVHYNLIILFTHRRWTGVNLMTSQKGTTRRSLWMATEIWNGYCLLHRRRSWLVESAAVWKLLLKFLGVSCYYVSAIRYHASTASIYVHTWDTCITISRRWKNSIPFSMLVSCTLGGGKSKIGFYWFWNARVKILLASFSVNNVYGLHV